MLRIWIILTALSACSLIAASCAQTNTAVAAGEAAEQAEQAATIASTEVYQSLQNTATQMSSAFNPASNPSAPVFPGFTVVETSDSYILVRNGQIIVIKKSSMYGYTGPPHDH